MTLTVPLPAPVRSVAALGQRDQPVVSLPVPEPRLPSAATEEAYQRGVRDGEDRLREQLLAQRNEFLELQRGVLESLRQALPGVVRDAEQHLIALALEAAQRLVAGLPISAELVTATVREALAQVEESSQVIVSLHPDDLALLKPGEFPGVEFRATADLQRGDCLAQTQFGVVDARRDTKLAKLREALES